MFLRIGYELIFEVPGPTHMLLMLHTHPEQIRVLQRPEKLHVIITGRDAPQELIEFADLVTEMREIKHPYRAGIRAQPGVEF